MCKAGPRHPHEHHDEAEACSGGRGMSDRLEGRVDQNGSERLAWDPDISDMGRDPAVRFIHDHHEILPRRLNTFENQSA